MVRNEFDVGQRVWLKAHVEDAPDGLTGPYVVRALHVEEGHCEGDEPRLEYDLRYPGNAKADQDGVTGDRLVRDDGWTVKRAMETIFERNQPKDPEAEAEAEPEA